MFCCIFMKILETKPARYDRGLNILTGGHARKLKTEIVNSRVKYGIHMLDVGCGTGELLEQAARAGALVSGIDISEGMLAIACKRFESEWMILGSGLFWGNRFFIICRIPLFTGRKRLAEGRHFVCSRSCRHRFMDCFRPSQTLVGVLGLDDHGDHFWLCGLVLI